MVGGQHHDHPARHGRQLVEEDAQRRIETQHLLAHLGALRAIAVTDLVGGRQTDAQHVGDAATAQLLTVQQLGGALQRQLIQQGRSLDAVVRGRQGRVEGLPADDPLAFQTTAGVIRIGPGRRLTREAVDHPRIDRRDRRQPGLGRLARLDIGGEAEALGQPEGAVALVPGQVDGPAILAGNAEDAAGRADRLQPVAERRGLQHIRPDRAVVGVPAVRQGVLRRGQAIGLLARRGVDPVVGRDAAVRRMDAGQDGGMPGAGHGDAVRLIAVDRDQAVIGQGLQPAGELAAILVEQVGAQLIDHQGHDQSRRRALSRCRRRHGLSRLLRHGRKGCTGQKGERQGRSQNAAEDHLEHRKH